MIYRIYTLTAVLLASLSLAVAEERASGVSTNLTRVEDFVLDDQFKNPSTQAFPKERVSIYALADRKGSDQLEDWITPFYTRYEDRVDICGVANMKGLPKMLRPMLRRIFKKQIDYPVMMDWTGDVCAAFDYEAGVADIFVVDRAGRVVHRISGEATAEKLNACFAAIDRLNEQHDSERASEERDPPPGQAPPASEATSGEPPRES